MSQLVKLSAITEGTSSREAGREAVRLLPSSGPFDLDLDREPSLSFLDGLVREMRESGRLEGATLITRSDLVLRHLGRFVAHDPSIEVWVRNADGRRARVELPDEEPVVIEDGPIAEDVRLR